LFLYEFGVNVARVVACGLCKVDEEIAYMFWFEHDRMTRSLFLDLYMNLNFKPCNPCMAILSCIYNHVEMRLVFCVCQCVSFWPIMNVLCMNMHFVVGNN
jgi:hypothetical protein